MSVRILLGDVRSRLKELPDESVHCCVTSPPYFGLRDYGVAGQIGLEKTPDDYIAELVNVFREVRRVLRKDGTLWLNLGDSYNNADKWGGGGANTGKHTREPDGTPASWKAVRRKWSGIGTKPKDLMMIPARVALALQADGWWLRSDIIWHKPNPMPESVTDRPTSAHEHIFLLAKSEKYWFDADAVREPIDEDYLKARWGGSLDRTGENGMSTIERSLPTGKSAQCGVNPLGRNIRNVWTIATQPFSEAHFATFPPALVEPCIKAGCPADGTVLDPFGGAGTTGLVADRLGRNAILCELNPEYAAIAKRRLETDGGMFSTVELAA